MKIIKTAKMLQDIVKILNTNRMHFTCLDFYLIKGI